MRLVDLCCCPWVCGVKCCCCFCFCCCCCCRVVVVFFLCIGGPRNLFGLFPFVCCDIVDRCFSITAGFSHDETPVLLLYQYGNPLRMSRSSDQSLLVVSTCCCCCCCLGINVCIPPLFLLPLVVVFVYAMDGLYVVAGAIYGATTGGVAT